MFQTEEYTLKKVQRGEESRINLEYSVQRSMGNLCSGEVAVSCVHR